MPLLLYLIVFSGILVFLLYSAIVFYSEGAKRALVITLLIASAVLAMLVLPVLIPWNEHRSVIILITMGALVVVFILNPKQNGLSWPPLQQTDERTTMFSRKELAPESEAHQQYYSHHPQHLQADKLFRSKPGLLHAQAAFYHPFGFRAAEAAFSVVKTLVPLVQGRPSGEPTHFSPSENTRFVINWTKKLGALEAGIAPMKPYHFYSHKGRGAQYGERINNNHPYGIAFTVEMAHQFLNSAPHTPIVMESAQQYLDAGSIAIQLAVFIRSCGYEATAHIDGNYEVVCPLVAKDAGLGELGRMGLLMTPRQGPRVRIAVVTTNMPLIPNKPFHDPTLTHFCRICKKCAACCPGQAIPSDHPTPLNGRIRWQINQEACYTYWCLSGTDCGRCMQVCPFSHPDNLLHNLIRFAIRHSMLFRLAAAKLDDLFYGAKPAAKSLPEWLPQKNRTIGLSDKGQ
ncbi:MAG: reductive dehalogenase domain-containing protein [Bacteroidales bacterium]|nr:reductive dehalogenase domain-containing protein [Bacteroidales bacterium]MDD3666953.1 reductive dehalogenase domain-containing protein [Bacteroidales bacterium]